MTPIDFMLALQDKISDPASRIERQLHRVSLGLREVDIQAKQNALSKITDPLKRQQAELRLQRDRLLLSKAALDKTGESSRKAGHEAGFFTRQLHDILHIAQIVGGALERMGLSLSHVIGAISFKQGSMIGLDAILGKGAEGTFERLEALAGKIGKPIEQVVNLGRTLANVGVKAGDLEPMVRLIEDLDSMDPGAGEKLAGVIRGIYSTGMMKSGDVEALRGTILKPEKIFEDIANRYGMGKNRFAGKAILDTEIGVGKNIGVSTLLDQVLGLEGGKAGSASGRGGLTLESRLARVGTQIERMFSRLAGSRGVKAFEKVLDNLIDLFNPDTKTGKGMFDRLTRVSDALARALDPLTGPEGKKRMEEFFTSLTKLLTGVIPILEKAARLTEIFVRYTAGERAPGAPRSVGEEVDQIMGLVTGTSVRERERRRWEIPGARANDITNRGLRGAETPLTVNINVDARGASKEDAEHIANKAAQKAKDALTDALERGLHGGGQ